MNDDALFISSRDRTCSDAVAVDAVMEFVIVSVVAGFFVIITASASAIEEADDGTIDPFSLFTSVAVAVAAAAAVIGSSWSRTKIGFVSVLEPMLGRRGNRLHSNRDLSP